jgi:ABC-type glycerol-3-phosphate transport system substrate-binding protein
MARTRIAALLAVAGIAVTGGSAYTAAIAGVPTTTYIGSASTTVSGANATSITYAYNVDYTEVATIDVVFTENTSARTLWVTPTGGGSSTPVSCGLGTYATDTSYSCTVTGSEWAVATLTNIRFSLT